MSDNMMAARTFCQSVVCCAVFGCGFQSSPVKSMPLSVSGAEISDVNEQSFTVTYRNNSNKPILVDSYYFGYAMEVAFENGGVKTFDFGADKVPVPLQSDKHVLKPGDLFGWTVHFPSEWGVKVNARRIAYYSMHPASNIPKHILEDYPKIQRLRLRANWKSGN